MIRIRPFIKPGDYGIVAFLILSTALSWFLVTHQAQGSRAVVYADGRESVVINLTEDNDVEVPGPLGYSVIRTRHGKLKMAASPCPNHLCVHMGEISGRGSTIVCVPNRILIRIAGSYPNDLDGITQ